MAGPTTTEPLFDLGEETPRLWIRGADGEPHELATFEDLSLNQRRSVAMAHQRLLVLEGLERDLTPAEEREYDARVSAIVQTVVPSLKVRDVKGMGREKREAVVTAFFSNRLIHRMSRALAEALAAQGALPTSEKSLPDSSTPTAEPTPAGG